MADAVMNEIDAALRREAFAQAEALLRQDGRWKQSGAGRLRLARLLRDQWCFHRAVLALGVVTGEGADDDTLEERTAQTIECLAAMRARGLLDCELARASARWPASQRFVLCQARIALAFDDRDTALARFAEITDPALAAAKSLGLARVHYAAGGFAAALTELDAISDEALWPAACRLRAHVCAATGDFAGEAKAFRQLVDRLPDSERRADDWLHAAFALAAAGEREAARTEFQALALAYPSSAAGNYAASRAASLVAAGANSTRKLLTFPTTQQKRNYCGPASLELCFRYLGIQLDQEHIAKQIKGEFGTSTHDMVRFLEQNGVRVRRTVASVAMLRACIDLGLAVILEEEYSTTFHVAVVTGYDEGLGVLIMQDPMTHRISTRPLSWAEAGKLRGCGAMVIVGRSADDLLGVEQTLDGAGIVDMPHLRVLDAACRKWTGSDPAAPEYASPKERLELANRALALDPHYRLAWLTRLRARLELMSDDHSQRSAFLGDLYQVRRDYADEEWPHQVHGQWLYQENRTSEGFVAYLEAHRRDPGDGNNLMYMTDAKFQMGRLADAEAHGLLALENHAEDGSVEWLMACTYLRAHVAATDKAAGNETTFARRYPETVESSPARTPEALLARAAFFAELSLEFFPNSAFYRETNGLILLRSGQPERAVAEFERALQLNEHRRASKLGLGVALAAAGRLEQGEAHLRKLHTLGHPDALSTLAQVFEARGDKAGWADTLLYGLSGTAEDRAKYLAPAWKACNQVEATREEAAERIKQAVLAGPFAGGLFFDAADTLNPCAPGAAQSLLRAGLQQSPDDDNVAGKLGMLLIRRNATRKEGITVLAPVVERSPEWEGPVRSYAIAVAAQDIARAREVMKPLEGSDDPWTLEALSYVLEQAGDTEAAERTARRALAAYEGKGEAAAARELIRWHLNCERKERALYWVSKLPKLAGAADMSEEIAGTTLNVYRQLGRRDEQMSLVRKLVESEIPAKIAWEVYEATKSVDHELARRAALMVKSTMTTDSGRLIWQVFEARQAALLGDNGPMAAVAEDARRSDDAAEYFFESYVLMRRLPEAVAWGRNLEQTYGDQPYAMTVGIRARLIEGDGDGALAMAQRLAERFPHRHAGPERVGLIFGQRLQPEQATPPAAAALAAAPYCHVAQAAHAAALFAADRLDEARLLAAESVDRHAEASDDNELAGLLLHALEGQAAPLELALKNRFQLSDPFPAFTEKLRSIANA